MKFTIRTPQGMAELTDAEVSARAAELVRGCPSQITCAFRVWYEGFEGYGMPTKPLVTAIEKGIEESGCWSPAGLRRFEKYGVVNAYTNDRYADAPKEKDGHTMIQHRFQPGAHYQGPDGKVYWVAVAEQFDLRCFERQDGRYVGSMVEIHPDSDYAKAMVPVK